MHEAGHAHAFIACLPADPLGFIAAEVHLSAGAFAGAVAQAEMAFAASRAGDDVVLGVVVEACFDVSNYACNAALGPRHLSALTE